MPTHWPIWTTIWTCMVPPWRSVRISNRQGKIMLTHKFYLFCVFLFVLDKQSEPWYIQLKETTQMNKVHNHGYEWNKVLITFGKLKVHLKYKDESHDKNKFLHTCTCTMGIYLYVYTARLMAIVARVRQRVNLDDGHYTCESQNWFFLFTFADLLISLALSKS